MKFVTFLTFFCLFFAGCASKNLTEYEFYGQKIEIPKELAENDADTITKECRANGYFKTASRENHYVTFSEKSLPICEISLGKKIIIDEIKYNRGGFDRAMDTTFDLLYLPLNILNALSGEKTKDRSGTYGIYRLGVYQKSEYGYALEGKTYDFGEDEQSRIIVKRPFGDVAVDKFSVAILALYYPKAESKPQEISGYVDEVEILPAGEVSKNEKIITYLLQNSDNITQNEILFLHYSAFENPSFFTKAKSMKNLKLPQNSIINYPNDIDLKYAFDNYKNVIESKKYKSINGDFKILWQENSPKTKSTKTQNITKNYKLQTSEESVNFNHTKKPRESTYIDFSQGI